MACWYVITYEASSVRRTTSFRGQLLRARFLAAVARAPRPALQITTSTTTLTHANMHAGPPKARGGGRVQPRVERALAHRLGRLDRPRRGTEDQHGPDATSRAQVI